MTACVLDASVAAKWFLPPAGETLVPEARQLLKDYSLSRLRLFVPDLFWPEMGNILWKSVRRGRISTRSAEDSIQELGEMRIPTTASQPLLREAFALATAFEQTVYDAIYVALALASGCPLITADERLANALAAHAPVRWLGSL